ncbi:MAG: antitoxin [Methanosarcinaceae archaeon]|nr:antitoxin [Methanosarcinaceae archaeon]
MTMTTKTITIREDVYRMLLSVKRNKESFSQLFERMVKSRSNLNKLKELHGAFEIGDKDLLLKEMSEKRKEIRY